MTRAEPLDLPLPRGWGFFDGSSLQPTTEELAVLPPMPPGVSRARQRAHVIAFLIANPALAGTVKASDLMDRYNIARNRAGEMFAFVREGRVPEQHRGHVYADESIAARAA